jgi:hypothetical protein
MTILEVKGDLRAACGAREVLMCEQVLHGPL